MITKCKNCSQHSNIKLSDEYIIYEGIKLFRIIAIKYFKDINKGDKGGYVQSLDNISGDAWIAGNAKVFEDGRIMDNALAKDNAIIRGNATVSKRAIVLENAVISGHAKIFGWAMIKGHARVSNRGQVSQDAKIGGEVEIQGLVFGKTQLVNDEFINSDIILPPIRAA